MGSLEKLISELTVKQVKRIKNSDKEYIVFDVMITNAIFRVDVICTNNYEKYQNIAEDGYSCILENNFDLINMLD